MRTLWDGASGLVMSVMVALPLWLVKVGVIGLFVGLALWALSLPAEYAYLGSDDRSRWRDVRIWAVMVIGLEIIPYLLF